MHHVKISFLKFMVDPEGSVFVKYPLRKMRCLTTESVQGTSLSFESIDYIHGGDSLPLGMLGICDGITDNVLQENLEDTTSLLVDESRDTLHTTTTSQPTDGRFSDTLDIITKNLAMPLGSSLPQTFASLAASSHVDSMCVCSAYELTTECSKQFRRPLYSRWRAQMSTIASHLVGIA